jgi:hypothetical protein
MEKPVDADTTLEQCVGRRVEAATSSLTYFAVILDGGQGLLAEAHPGGAAPEVTVAGEPAAAHSGGAAPEVTVAAVPADALPTLGDAVCAVDWSWIVGSTIRGGTLADGRLRLDLDPAGPLTVTAATWQDAPFLAFQPYKAPA